MTRKETNAEQSVTPERAANAQEGTDKEASAPPEDEFERAFAEEAMTASEASDEADAEAGERDEKSEKEAKETEPELSPYEKRIRERMAARRKDEAGAETTKGSAVEGKERKEALESDLEPLDEFESAEVLKEILGALQEAAAREGKPQTNKEALAARAPSEAQAGAATAAQVPEKLTGEEVARRVNELGIGKVMLQVGDEEVELGQFVKDYPEVGAVALAIAQALAGKGVSASSAPSSAEKDAGSSAVEAAAGESAKSPRDDTQALLKELRDQVDELQYQVAMSEFWRAVEREFPDARQIAASKAFHEWRARQSRLVQAACNSMDPADALDVLRKFKADTEGQNAAATAAKPSETARQKRAGLHGYSLSGEGKPEREGGSGALNADEEFLRAFEQSLQKGS